MRSRYVASVGKSRGVIETESLEMGKADERFVTFQNRDERECILEQLGELDALEVDGSLRSERNRAEENDARVRHAHATSERRLRGKEIAAQDQCVSDRATLVDGFL